MAIQLSATLPSGLEAPQAYWRIDELMINDKDQLAWITVNAYASAQARQEGKGPIPELRRTYGVPQDLVRQVMALSTSTSEPTVRDAIKTACYQWLMSLADFAGGVAV